MCEREELIAGLSAGHSVAKLLLKSSTLGAHLPGTAQFQQTGNPFTQALLFSLVKLRGLSSERKMFFVRGKSIREVGFRSHPLRRLSGPTDLSVAADMLLQSERSALAAPPSCPGSKGFTHSQGQIKK